MKRRRTVYFVLLSAAYTLDRANEGRDLIRHLETQGCELLREGGNHSLYVNRATQKATSVPRHSEIEKYLCVKICKDLQIPEP